MIISADFDGIIARSCWPAIGEPVPGALETLQQWHTDGHKVVIWTCRAGRELAACKQWLDAHNVPYDTIDANLPERIEIYGGSDTRKVSADLYVNDRAAGAPSDPVKLWALARERVSQLTRKEA